MYVIKQNPDNPENMQVYKTVNDSDAPNKVVATVTLLNLIQLEVTDQDDWTPPTQLQIDNLKRVFGVDIQIINQ